MTARLVMDPNPVSILRTDSIGVAARKIMQRRYRSLPVVDEEGRFLGVVTVQCMLNLVLPKAATMKGGVDSVSYMETTLEDLRARLLASINDPITRCLKEEVAVIDPETSLLETLLTLYREKCNLPVVDKKTQHLKGMISYYDVGEKIMGEGF